MQNNHTGLSGKAEKAQCRKVSIQNVVKNMIASNLTYKNTGTELTFSSQQQDLSGKIVS